MGKALQVTVIFGAIILQGLCIFSAPCAQEEAAAFPSISQAISSFPTAAMVTKADTAFVELARSFFIWKYSNNPVGATYIGLHEFDGVLDDFGPETMKKEEETTARFLKELSDLDPAQLSSTHRYDYSILKDHLEGGLFQMREIKAWEKSPLFYTEAAGGSIRSLLSREFAPLDVRLASVVSRLRQFPRLVEQARANIKTAPRINTQTAPTRDFIASNLRRASARSNRAKNCRPWAAPVKRPPSACA
ncbi:MAG: DUF885 family protein, partial [Candidatus Methanoperedens sp.]|nr:DUF885 family protein [Candidatus Methanoperedens sp.]